MENKETHAPQSDCPPPGAGPAEGDVFRCCKADPPAPGDMKTHEESGRLPNADACLRRALSVFRTQQDAEHQLRLFRKWRQKFVAKATLRAEHGRAMATHGQQPTHTSWWPSPRLDPSARAKLFVVTGEVRS